MSEKPPSTAATGREKRQAEALRENLKRRKDAAKTAPPDKK